MDKILKQQPQEKVFIAFKISLIFTDIDFAKLIKFQKFRQLRHNTNIYYTLQKHTWIACSHNNATL